MIIPKIELLSVIIPTRGRSHKLLNLLNALEQVGASTSCPFEVILVIDGDGHIPEMDVSYPLTVLKSTHIGAGPARNLGIQASQGDAVLFLNDDVIPQPGFLDAHVQALDAGNDGVLGASPWIQQEKNTDDPTANAFDGFIMYSPAIFDQHELIEGQRYGFRHGWTLNLSVRKSVMDQLRMHFDPLLRPIYFEDIEFAYRCFGQLNSIVYCPAAHVIHDHRVTMDEYFSREVLLGMMSVVLYEQNTDCYNELFPCSPDEHAQIASGINQLDTRDHRRLILRLVELFNEPLNASDPIKQARILYDVHLPIKRRAFRVGLSTMLKEQIPWNERVVRAKELIKSDPALSMLMRTD